MSPRFDRPLLLAACEILYTPHPQRLDGERRQRKQ
jgi:hypothetical protein